MAEKLEIEVVIGPDGNVSFETHGLKGQACLAETTGLEKALGKVVRREKTGEYYQQAQTAAGKVKRG
ncbi:MAG: DUF2997 domain-containing protein [Deltaproteobacteria bacterium]|nr:DUF2997 domain-containing protein [Deltaproteobacteria bacterium]